MTTPVEFEPAESQTSARAADEVNLLLTFVRDRDHPCPRCGYNLRNLTQPVCPECREDLVLKVGVHRVKLHWLLLTIAPSAFCAIASGMFVVMCFIEGPPPFMWQVFATVGFLVTSGLIGIVVAARSRLFLRQADQTQMAGAALAWSIHIAYFIIALVYF